jgi:sugar-specific transcriptional regulator TrmB
MMQLTPYEARVLVVLMNHELSYRKSPLTPQKISYVADVPESEIDHVLVELYQKNYLPVEIRNFL